MADAITMLQRMGDSAPDTVRRLVEDWRRRESPPQNSFGWPRQRWLDRFERHCDLLTGLPDALDRTEIRELCVDADKSPEGAETAFMAVMVWGYAEVGYGPWRSSRILAVNRDPVSRLQTVAETLRSDGPEPAYRRLSDYADCRLRFLGPAFGTKFLAFCSANEQQPALILDRLVAAWLARNTTLKLDAASWSPATYGRYLAEMYSWATLLKVRPDDLECQIFSAEADKIGNKWSSKRASPWMPGGS